MPKTAEPKPAERIAATATVDYTDSKGIKKQFSFGCILPDDDQQKIKAHARKWVKGLRRIDSITVTPDSELTRKKGQ